MRRSRAIVRSPPCRGSSIAIVLADGRVAMLRDGWC